MAAFETLPEVNLSSFPEDCSDSAMQARRAVLSHFYVSEFIHSSQSD